jgi:hypothetical protein
MIRRHLWPLAAIAIIHAAGWLVAILIIKGLP